jgi:hypothetical protein
MPPDPDRQALIEQITQRFRKQVEEHLPDDNATLDQIEEALDRIGKEVLSDLQQRLARKRATKARDNTIDCACGGRARYRNRATRTLITRHGVLHWTRPYYHCAHCKRGLAPLDASLGLDRGETTTAVRNWAAQLSAQVGFVQATTVLRSVCALDLSPSTVERIAVHVGASLRRAQSQEAFLHHRDCLPDEKTASPSRLYIGADGVMTPLRDAWKKDGSLGKLTCRYGECKTGVLYQAHRDKEGHDTRVKTRAYIATLDGVETFELLLGRLAHRCGHHRAKELVVLGDGAPWLWFMFARLFPEAIQILDFYHACEHLAHVSEAIYGKGSDLSRQWQKARQAELKQNRIVAVLQAIAAWKPTTADHFKLRRTEFGYFRHNAQRMRYKTFLSKGYHIGSGVVEAACKQVIAQRLDQVGMHWNRENAEAILTLRAAQLSTYPPDLRPHLALGA